MNNQTMIKVFILLIFFNFCFPYSILWAAEPLLKLDLETALKMAFETNEDLKLKENDILIRESLYKETRASIYPNLNSETTWSSNLEYPDSAQSDDYSLSAGVTANQLVWSFGKVSSAIKAAEKYLEISDLDKEITQREITYQTKLSYYTALLAQNTYEIVQKSYDNAKINKEILENRSATGRVSKKDNIKISSDIAIRIPTMNNAKINLETALKTLKRIIGIEMTAQVMITDRFAQDYNPLDAAQYKKYLLDRDPTLKALKENISLNDDLVQIKKSSFYPEISAFMTLTYKGDSGQAQIGGDSAERYSVVGLKVSVPIWNGGEKHEELRQARLEKKNAQVTYDKNRKDLMLDLDVAVTKYNQYINILQANNESVRLAEESFQMSQDLFRSGQLSSTDLNDAELTLTNERLSQQQTLYNLNVTRAKIEKYTTIWQSE